MTRRGRRQGSDEDLEQELLDFAEHFALVYDLELPRIAGKVLGYLLVCDPPALTQTELADALSASRGSISTMTRLLEQSAWIERVSVRGERQVRYRVRVEAWSAHIDVHIQRANNLYNVAAKARELLESQPPERRWRIDMTADFADFWRQGLPHLLDRWNEGRENKVVTNAPRSSSGKARNKAGKRAS